ncbi:MAG: lipocalin, partial [Candidatus Dadabacteria bacterium]
TYSLRDDGLIRVQNRGYNVAEGAWSEAVGRADFVDSSRVGRLKVSFFGPFWGGYNVVRYDPARGLALVVGPKLDWVWILSRTAIPATDDLLRAESWLRSVGVDPESLHWTKHDPGMCAEGGSSE